MELSHGFISPFQGASPPAAAASTSIPASSPHARLGPEGVGRLVVQSIGGPSWCSHLGQEQGSPTSGNDAGLDGPARGGVGGGLRGEDQCEHREEKIVCFVRQLRQIIQDTRCSAMVTVPAGGLRSYPCLPAHMHISGHPERGTENHLREPPY